VVTQQHLLDSLVAALEIHHKKSQQNRASDEFYKNIGTMSALGSSITFGLIISNIANPKVISQHGRFDLSTIRILLAVSWLLFIVVLNLSFSFAQNMPRYSRAWQIRASKILYFLVIAAVMCLALVVVGYVEVIGYIGIAFASIVALLVLTSQLEDVIPH
jgi:hypothetical protein